MGFAIFYFFMASSLYVTRVTSDVRFEILYLFLSFASSSFMTYSFSLLDFLAVFNFLSFVFVSFEVMFFFCSIEEQKFKTRSPVFNL